jgi:uncharacterized protein
LINKTKVQEIVTLLLTPEDASKEKNYKQAAAKKLGIEPSRITFIRITKKSVDARHKDVRINLSVQVFIDEAFYSPGTVKFNYSFVGNQEPVIIIGSGPAGLFAALRFIELGIKPVIFERGKDVSERKKDIALINREHLVNPESNYCFGEGGAGTFSDGKLYTRSNKRGNLQKIYEVLHFHGAVDDILFEAHPHIGTDKLPELIKNIRQTILNCGGEVNFNTRIDDLIIDSDIVKGVITQNGESVYARCVIMATGHSARDFYKMLHSKNIALENKQFAVGIRAEHSQELIDKIQYHGTERGEYLPAATYNLAEQINGRGMFTFCMCPGGFIVPSATLQNQVVVNGMSPSGRNSPYANSGIVVEVKQEDLAGFSNFGIMAGIEFQEHLENMAWQNGGRKQTAPAQRLDDFVKGRMSSSLPKTSYIPGIISSPLHHWLPDFISNTLREGFKKFEQKMRGFITADALVLGVESRTSSPLRIPRDKDSFCNISIKGLFPCGEGSGYAGGIASSAMDGENTANKVAEFLKMT